MMLRQIKRIPLLVRRRFVEPIPLFQQIGFIFSLACAVIILSGCSNSHPQGKGKRPFDFATDTFAYANELTWDYIIDPTTGETITRKRNPPPDYTLHCFVVARSARQFFQFAEFDPAQPRADAETYRKIVREITSRSLRKPFDGRMVVVPGYSNLKTFSQDYETVLKEECGGAWQSYFQRGHWRMLFPFSRRHQGQMSQQIVNALKRNQPPVIHVVRFPTLKINHAIVLYDFEQLENGIRFWAYDPNTPDQPVPLSFDNARNTFYMPRNNYFAGGHVDVYEVYHAANY